MAKSTTKQIISILSLYQTALEEAIYRIDGGWCGSFNNCTSCSQHIKKSCLNRKLLLNRKVLKQLNKTEEN